MLVFFDTVHVPKNKGHAEKKRAVNCTVSNNSVKHHTHILKIATNTISIGINLRCVYNMINTSCL